MWLDEDINYWYHVNDYYRDVMHAECGIPEYTESEVQELRVLNLELLSDHCARLLDSET